VYSIVPTEDAKVYVGGAFTTYNSAPHLNSIVRLEKDGGIDTSFKMGEGPKAGFNGIVMAMAVGKSGLLYVGGNFSRYKGKKVSNFVRLFPNGSLDESYTKGFDGDVKTILISKEGLVYVGGDFSNYLSQGRQSAKRLARLTQSGQLDERFFIGKGFNATVNEINYSKTKDLIVVGAFSTYNGKKVPSRFVRLNVLGHMLDTFSADFSQDGVQGEIKGFAELKTNGESLYLFGGEFTKVNGKNRFGTFSVTEDGKLLD